MRPRSAKRATPSKTYATKGGCDEPIDRGLAYLCGDELGRASDGACGRWFCAQHLFYGRHGQRCEACLEDEEDAEDES